MRKHDRNGSSSFQQYRYDGAGGCQDRIRRETNQLGCILAKTTDIARSPTNVDVHVVAIDPTQSRKLLPESHEPGLSLRICCHWRFKDSASQH
jgi:hypothetical protein